MAVPISRLDNGREDLIIETLLSVRARLAAVNGEPLVKGKSVAGFTNTEEEAVQLTDIVPFLVEDELIKLGGDYSKRSDWESYVIADGLLITGQNPQSSAEAADVLIAKLSSLTA